MLEVFMNIDVVRNIRNVRKLDCDGELQFGRYYQNFDHYSIKLMTIAFTLN